MQRDREYTVILDAKDDGGYRAWCPEFQACFAEGGTCDEVLERIGSAIAERVPSQRFVLKALERNPEA